MVTVITKARDLTNMKLEDLVGTLRAHEPLLLADKPSRKEKMIALKTSQTESSSSKKTEEVMKKESSEYTLSEEEDELALISRRIQRMIYRRGQDRRSPQKEKTEKISFLSLSSPRTPFQYSQTIPFCFLLSTKMARIKTTDKRKILSFDPETDSQNYSSSESAGQGIKHKSVSPPRALPQPLSQKTKKPSSSKPTASTRRSSRVQSGAVSSSKKVPQDFTVHVVDSDDSKGNTSAPSIPKSSSKTSTPKRSKTKSTEQDSETNYTSKWINKFVVHGKHIDLINLKNGGFNIEEVFDKLGWTSFFRVNEPQYPLLVKAFYAACNGCKGSPGFSFVLKGVHLEVNPTTLCKILDLQDAGAHCFAETWYMQYLITRTSVLQNILINPRKPLVASYLPPMCRIFHNICVHSIMPRAGSFEKVIELDILIIHHLLTGTPLHLGNIIFSYMLNAAIVGRSAPYGMILTKVFKFFKVPLDDEERIQCNNFFSMKNIKQMRIDLPEQTPTSRKKKTASKKQKFASPLSHSRTPTSSFNSVGSTLPQSP
uniref:Uncharacterized protein LOC101489237 n=1 Tax=Cicer arietinum TaxID=3827 RepID=A0A1S2YTI1_CICAR|nr:uncharacterized protein LOC101489237 [Cicer arietinum]